MQTVTHFDNLQNRHRFVIGRRNLCQGFVQIGIEWFTQSIDGLRSVSLQDIFKLIGNHTNAIHKILQVASLLG